MRSRDKIFSGSVGMVIFIVFLLLVFVAWPSYEKAIVEQFDGYPAGTIVAGEQPGGDAATGDFFPGFTLSVVSAGNGPHTALLAEAAPGATQTVQSGEEVAPFLHRLIIAQDIADDLPGDGLVDEPRCAEAGGRISFTFRAATIVFEIAFSDLNEEARVGCTLYADGQTVGSAQTSVRQDDAAEVLSLESFGPITKLDVDFGGAGAIAWIKYSTPPAPTSGTTWGRLKALFD